MEQSRLDRLLKLLESGSAAAKRQTAAQFGLIQQQRPEEFRALVRRVYPFLMKPDWDTRVAAAQAIQALLKSRMLQMMSKNSSDESGRESVTHNNLAFLRRFDNFDLAAVLRSQSKLLAAEDNRASQSVVESAAFGDKSAARRRIDQQLLDLDPTVGISSTDWFSDEDLTLQVSPLTPPVEKRLKVEVPSANEIEWQAERWELAELCQWLLRDICHVRWECRHGAVLALKELVQHAWQCLGVVNVSNADDSALNARWLEHLCCQVLQVMARDRFCDFTSAAAVAPVRECCAQIVGWVGLRLDGKGVEALWSALDQFAAVSNVWEMKHCALLALKYMLALCQLVSDQAALLSAKHWQRCVDFLADCFGYEQRHFEDVFVLAGEILLNLVQSASFPIGADRASKIICSCWQLVRQFANSEGSDDLEANEEEIAVILRLLAVLTESNSQSAQPSIDWQHHFCTVISLIDSPLTVVRDASLQLAAAVVRMFDLESMLCSKEVDGKKNNNFEKQLQVLLNILVRRCLTESSASLRQKICDFFACLANKVDIHLLVCPYLGIWMSYLMISCDNPQIVARFEASTMCGGRSNENGVDVYIGGTEVLAMSAQQRREMVIQNQYQLAEMLTQLIPSIIDDTSPICGNVESPSAGLRALLLLHLNSMSAQRRSAVAMLLAQLARPGLYDDVKAALLRAACSPPAVYEETASKQSQVNAQCTEFLSKLLGCGLLSAAELASNEVAGPPYSLEDGKRICILFDTAANGAADPTLSAARAALEQLLSVVESTTQQVQLHTSVWLVYALLRMRVVPQKFNPFVKPLMDCLKLEEGLLRSVASDAIALLLDLAQTSQPSPNAKIVKNLCSLLCADSKWCPVFDGEDKDSIKSLLLLDAVGFCVERGKKRNGIDVGDIESQSQGAADALKSICLHFGARLPKDLQCLWSNLANIDASPSQLWINSIRAVELLLPHVDRRLQFELFNKHFEAQLAAVASELSQVRHMASRLLSRFAEQDSLFEIAMNRLVSDWLLNFYSNQRPISAQPFGVKAGFVELAVNLQAKLENRLVGYISFVAPLVLQLMSDNWAQVREAASRVFAALVSLMPLENQPPADLSDKFTHVWHSNFEFIEHLMYPSKLNRAELQFEPKGVQLRPYQREGVQWLLFLKQYSLHGILCDDMGLGKTVQTLCAMCASHATEGCGALSLIVCPSSVTGHWVQEMQAYMPGALLRPLLVHNKTKDDDIKGCVGAQSKHNVLVISYDSCRKRLATLSDVCWLYLVLDEGHVIKNPKTQLFKALTSLQSRHRLILSGTPVQNSVLELWALFEFLMPSYLGTSAHFQARFGKPILDSRSAKSNSSSAEGRLALERLHKQVLPFVLRRQKSDVLQDLPPKIIQDYLCELTPLQRVLYEHFTKMVAEEQRAAEESKNSLQILMYLRRLCDHPALVLHSSHPKYLQISSELRAADKSIDDFELSGKLVGLVELLVECGIIRDGDEALALADELASSSLSAVVSQHRALVFCQFKAMLDLIGKLMARFHVSYLRLDGSVPVGQRQAVVDQFNSDPSVDVLLLTTQVGGLGLNLTGADVVVFVDHDWNPTKDLQAMDRAHRLGQRKTVNVYRLITQSTIEQKIMQLQRFKTHVANAVIGEDNKAVVSMVTGNLIDLLSLDSGESAKQKGEKPKSVSQLLDSLPDLSEAAQQYEAFDIAQFMQSLRSSDSNRR